MNFEIVMNDLKEESQKIVKLWANQMLHYDEILDLCTILWHYLTMINNQIILKH